MINDVKKEAEQRMQRGVEAFKEDLRKLRTGRAHARLLEHVMVEYYGTNVPVKQTANISVEEARGILTAYFEAFPSVKAYMDRTVEDARDRGYTETLFGRRRPIPELQSRNRGIRMAGERQGGPDRSVRSR